MARLAPAVLYLSLWTAKVLISQCLRSRMGRHCRADWAHRCDTLASHCGSC